MRVFTGEGAGGQGRAASKGERQRKPGQAAGLFEWSAVRCRPAGRGSEEQQNERAMIFCKKKRRKRYTACTFAARQGGRGPHENLRSKVLWGEGGMTERYEKSPAKRLGFLNGAQCVAARQGGQGPCENLRSKVSRGEGAAAK